jgi:hypothetical protein
MPVLDSCHSTVACHMLMQICGYGAVKKHACTFKRPVIQRLGENRRKETPQRLVGHGPSDDNDTCRGLRNPIGLLS